MEKLVAGYADFLFHRRVAAIIKDHSENRTDIRSIAAGMVAWSDVRKILDIGCGYGWFEEALPGRFDSVIGMDSLEENRTSFLEAATKITENPVFVRTDLVSGIEAASDAFDLVVAAYSLYFFPDIIPEVKRVLGPGGIFLVITHSQRMLEEGERFFQFNNLRRIISRFSAENGESKLRECFADVSYVDYPNALSFARGTEEHLADYITFKREFIATDADPDLVRKTLLGELKSCGVVRFNKNDRIFKAVKPGKTVTGDR